MDTIITRVPRPSRQSWRTVAAAIAVGVAIVVAFFTVNGLVRDPDVVSRLEVRNQTDDLVDVLVRSSDGGSLLPVAIVEPQRRAVAHDVVDQGDDWTFVVQTSGDTVARIRMTHDELDRARWTVTIPNPGGAATGTTDGG